VLKRTLFLGAALAVIAGSGCGARSELYVGWLHHDAGGGGGAGQGGSGGGTGQGGSGGSSVACVEGIFGFLPFGSYPTGHTPLAIVGGDFDHDGDLDLAVGASGPEDQPQGGFTVHLNNGDATFAPADHYDENTPHTGLATGDFNLDGHLDLAALGLWPAGGGCLNPYEGLGNGKFVGIW